MRFTKELKFKYSDESCTFRSIAPEDVTSAYIEGLRLENEYLAHIPDDLSIQSQQRYISQIIESDEATICGLFVGEELIGTAGLQNLAEGAYAAVGIFLFSTMVRGKGFGKVLVWAASRLAISQMALAGTMGGMKPDNIASLKSFLACGGVSNFNPDTGINQVHISATNLIGIPGLTEIQLID